MPETMTILSHVNPLLQMGVKDDVVFSFFKKNDDGSPAQINRLVIWF